ncbi:MAG: peptidase M64 [Ignavibacteriales bacterium]|nr:peptidase M64 [Ignavibacteriales bacterium]
MKKILLFLLISLSVVYPQIKFDDNFAEKTLRLDFYHTGNKNTETISFDKLIEEPIWSGTKKNLIDQFGYGSYLLKIFDDSTNTLIYSRGFSTLFQEWQTTEEAKNTLRSFSGSVVMPFPKNKVRVEILKRDRRNNFEVKFSYNVNPQSYFIIKEKAKPFPNFKVHYSGEPSQKLDIVLIPEGYSSEEMNKFKEDCNRFAGYLFEYSPFKENQNKINIWGVEAPSVQSGTDIPGKNIWMQTLLNSHFYTFDSERYLMTTDYFAIRDVAANAPNDQIYVIVNTEKYGGGAIYNYYNVTAADNKLSKQIFVHEFGHGLAGLADEYGDDPTYQDFYPLDVEPWEPNVTTLVNFESKWKNLVNDGTPIPTPDEEKYKNKIGAFEGAGYVPKGVYRPTGNSIMRAFSSNEFNEVCKSAIEKIINSYTE